MILLLTLPPEELKRLREGGSLASCRGYAAAAPDLIPSVVAEDSCRRFEAGEEWFWCSPRLFLDEETGLVVGAGSFKNSPRHGRVEIGYGVAAGQAGRGFATSGAARLVEEAFSMPEVTTVTAETSTANRASERVLEKNGFVRSGSRIDPEDGPLTLWSLPRP